MISTKGRYALRVMIHLAEGPSTFAGIAERQEISPAYLKVVIRILLKHQLIEQVEEEYRLTRPSEDYTAGEILEFAEGSLSMVECLAPDAKPCHRAAECHTLPMWREFNTIVHDFFYKITLKDLMTDHCFFNNVLS